MKLWDDVGDPLYVSMPLPDCLYHVSFRRYWPRQKRANVKVFGLQFFGMDDPDFSVSAIYCLPFSKVADRGLHLRSLAMK